MPEVSISGISVKFPFQPYDVQKDYMAKVIECLQTASNGILESPTGTGKTLCLLCSTLAWLEVKKAQAQVSSACQSLMQANGSQSRTMDDVFKNSLLEGLSNAAGVGFSNSLNIVMPKIIYSSRTHAQLSQVVQELKRSEYKHVKATVLGSRDQLCLHPEVMKETNSSTKIHMCRAKVTARTCPYYNNVESSLSNTMQQSPVVDIEDLIKVGTKSRCCPYYLSRGLKQEADITFMPYNYLLDSKARKSHAIELEGNVVIFDEAHNVEKMCEENASVEIRSQDIAACISDVTQAMQQVTNLQQASDSAAGGAIDNYEPPASANFTLHELCLLKTMMCELEDNLDKIPLDKDGAATFPGSYMFEFLEKVEIRSDKKAVVLDLLDKVIQFLSEGSSSVLMRRGNGLQKFADTIRVVFYKDIMNRAYLDTTQSCYKVHVAREEEAARKQRGDVWNNIKSHMKPTRALNYWCFNPGVCMQSLLENKARCVILTSGTLAPLETFAAELRISLPVRLENPHIVGKNQVWIGVVPKGPDGVQLNSSFNNRSDPRYMTSLGHTIVNFARTVPDGLLVFFPSYTIMSECQKAWESQHIWQALGSCKTIFVESRSKRDFQQVMEEFYKESTPGGKGAVFLAVCRGKVSEGLDFADHNGRAVIITGLPFPPWKDPKVTLKMAYQNEQLKTKKQGLNGNDWYRLEASRAVNQAIGRVIRHKDDYGAIILCDSRFGEKNFQSQLSAWLRPLIQNHQNFGSALVGVKQFFKAIAGQEREIRMTMKLSSPKVGGSTASVSRSTGSYSIPAANPRSSHFKLNTDDGQNGVTTDWSTNKLLYGFLTDTLNKPSSQDLVNALVSADVKMEPSAAQLARKHSLISSQSFSDFDHIAPKKRKLNVLGPGKQQSGSISDLPACSVVGTTPKSDPTTLESPSASSTANGDKDACSSAKTVELSQNDNKSKYMALIAKMKKNCSTESYEKFKALMKSFALNRDSEKLAEGFLAICYNKEILECLKEFRNFIPKDQRQLYNDYMTKARF